MKIGPGVSELWGVENRPLPLTWPMAYTTACTTVQAVITPISTGTWLDGLLVERRTHDWEVAGTSLTHSTPASVTKQYNLLLV